MSKGVLWNKINNSIKLSYVDSKAAYAGYPLNELVQNKNKRLSWMV